MTKPIHEHKHSAPKKPKMSPEELERAVYEVDKYVQDIAKTFSLMGITMVKGKINAFDPKTQIIYYNPEMLAKRGASYKETLFIVMHEVRSHFEELMLDPVAYMREFDRTRGKDKEHLALLNNILEDIHGNKKLMAHSPFLKETTKNLYETELFPNEDYTDLSRHTQFAYAIIRERMVTVEGARVRVTVDPEVRKAIDSLEKYKGRGAEVVDAIDYVTRPGRHLSVNQRINLYRSIIEPVYLRLFEQDLADPKKRPDGQPHDQSEAGEGEQGGGGYADPTQRQDPKDETPEQAAERREKERARREEIRERMKGEYKQYEDGHHSMEIFDHKDIEEIREAIKKSGGLPNDKANTGSNVQERLDQMEAKKGGVTPEELRSYRSMYESFAPIIDELRALFKEVVAYRLVERQRLSRELKKEGPELDDIVTAYIESLSNTNREPAVYRDFEQRPVEAVSYGGLHISIVADLSGSMNPQKLEMQKKCALILVEALSDFEQEVKEAELQTGLSLELDIQSEVRAFQDGTDTVIRPLGHGLFGEKTLSDRVKIQKRLSEKAGGTPDFLSLRAINAQLDKDKKTQEMLREKKLRKVVIVLTDGGSDSPSEVAIELKKFKDRGVIVLGLGMTDQGESVLKTYGGQGAEAEVIYDVTKLPAAFASHIMKYVQDI